REARLGTEAELVPLPEAPLEIHGKVAPSQSPEVGDADLQVSVLANTVAPRHAPQALPPALGEVEVVGVHLELLVAGALRTGVVGDERMRGSRGRHCSKKDNGYDERPSIHSGVAPGRVSSSLRNSAL